jgi:hypothetical protein
MWSSINSKIGAWVLGAITEALGCFCLYYGTAMMLIVPGYPGEHYLSWGRFIYGFAPTVLSLGLLALAGWFWSRAGGPASLGTYVQRAFLGAAGLVLLFWVGLIVIAHLQGRIP